MHLWGKVVLRCAFALLAAALLVGCAGCAGCAGREGEVLPIPDWTLLTPGGAVAVELPAHLNDRLPPGRSRYALRARVSLPPAFEGKPLTLTTFVPAIATLRVDGHEAVALDPSPFDRYRNNGPHCWRLTAEQTRPPAIDLEIEVDHRWVQSAWIDRVPVLSATPAGDPKFAAVTGFNQIATGAALVCTLFISFLYGVIFLLERARTVNAWHSAQGIFAAFYPACLLGYLQPVFGAAEAAVMALGVTTSAVCSVHFVAEILGLPRPSRAWWLLPGGLLGLGVLARDPFRATFVLPPVAVMALTAASAYGIVSFVRARRRGPTPIGSTFAALAYPITLLLGVPDAAALLGFGTVAWGLRGGAVAIAGISVIQALALSRNHSESLKRTDHLNEQLQARVALLETNNQEIRVLNEELRRQVATRSQHLAEALARLGPVFARPRDFAADDVIDGRYKVVRRIGEGGMGTVYEVERLVDRRRLALKVLLGQRSGAELARLAREAEIATRVDHPNVVSMVDVDVSASGAVFLVMEYVDGASLDNLTHRYGDTLWALRLLGQIARGLAAIHARDIVHRDLKPGNVLVTRDPAGGDLAKIADFGIATFSASRDRNESPAAVATQAPQDDVALARTLADENGTTPGLTRTGQVLGTPLYMAPELARGAKNASAASDMYAMGVMAFELLTRGRASGEDAERFDHLRSGTGAALAFGEHTPTLPPALAVLLDRCLAHDPAARPTAQELAEAVGAAGLSSSRFPAARGIPPA